MAMHRSARGAGQDGSDGLGPAGPWTDAGDADRGPWLRARSGRGYAALGRNPPPPARDPPLLGAPAGPAEAPPAAADPPGRAADPRANRPRGWRPRPRASPSLRRSRRSGESPPRGWQAPSPRAPRVIEGSGLCRPPGGGAFVLHAAAAARLRGDGASPAAAGAFCQAGSGRRRSGRTSRSRSGCDSLQALDGTRASRRRGSPGRSAAEKGARALPRWCRPAAAAVARPWAVARASPPACRRRRASTGARRCACAQIWVPGGVGSPGA